MTTKLILFISGFTQTGKKSNGVSNLFRWALITRRALGASDYRVELRTWRANWEAEAEYFRRDLGVSEVRIVSYSWGVGWGAMQLAKYLQRLGIKVVWLVSCDGVYRWGKLSIARANPLNFRTMFHKGPLAPKIKVPSNVGAVYPLRRRASSKIRGHDFNIVNTDRTKLHDTQWLTLPHSEMDDSIEFENLVKQKLVELWEG